MDIITAFYKFTHLSDPNLWRAKLKSLTGSLELRGTILLAAEGINGTISGRAECIATFKSELEGSEPFAGIEFKDSQFSDVSFRRMLVKVKKEIITMRQAVDPRAETGDYLDPLTFQEWQQEGKEMLILDTRNDYEFALGSFEQAIDPGIKSFGEFPEWVDRELTAKDKETPIVTFCTGGIRCEKATAYMKKKGFREVYQLRGGILKYLEESAKSDKPHFWRGECVVFDKRKAVTSTLEASARAICFVCLGSLAADASERISFPAGEACQSCGEEMRRSQAKRLERGRTEHAENITRRAAFLKEQRARYEAQGLARLKGRQETVTGGAHASSCRRDE